MSALKPSSYRLMFLKRPVATACFAASVAAFGASLAGWIINQVLTEVMAVLGMAMVGLFYLALGLWQIGFVPAEEEAALLPPQDAEAAKPAALNATFPVSRPLSPSPAPAVVKSRLPLSRSSGAIHP